MREAETKAKLMAVVAQSRARWENMLAEIDEQRMMQPGAMGDWTFKDVVAHLTAWRVRSIQRLEAALTDTEVAPPPWPDFPGTEDEEDHVELTNQWIYRENRDKALAEILRESAESWRRFTDLAQAIPEEKLWDRERYAWLKGYTVADAVRGSLDHFHDEHEEGLRAWIAQFDGSPTKG